MAAFSNPTDYFWRWTHSPSELALKDARTQFSGNDLFTGVQRLSQSLTRKGIHKQDRVAVICGKSASQVISMMSLWSLGAVYVPISLNNPQARIDYLLDDGDIRYVLIEEDSAQKKFQFGGRVVISVLAEIQKESGSRPRTFEASARPEDIAYIIYTSGTTGQPKGVVIEIASLMRLFQTAEETFTELTAPTVFLQVVDFSFDVSIWDALLWLVKGGTLVIADIGQNVFKLVQLIVEHRPSYLCNAAPTYALLMTIKPLWAAYDLSFIRSVITTASYCPPPIAKHILESFPQARVYNCYGPTETTVYCCWTELTLNSIDVTKSLSIGHVLPGLKAYLYDGVRLHSAPSADEGKQMELCIQGIQVFREYWKAPELTAQKILLSEAGERVYRTGDIVSRKGSDFYYVGRTDDTIKIKGHRVNLGEIELCLHGSGVIGHCAVLNIPGQDYESYLVAFYSMNNATNASDEETAGILRKHCEINLPGYMIPKHFIRLAEFPLSPAGKIDRSLLRRQCGASL